MMMMKRRKVKKRAKSREDQKSWKRKRKPMNYQIAARQTMIPMRTLQSLRNGWTSWRV
jgi:hypothetical protein